MVIPGANVHKQVQELDRFMRPRTTGDMARREVAALLVFLLGLIERGQCMWSDLGDDLARNANLFGIEITLCNAYPDGHIYVEGFRRSFDRRKHCALYLDFQRDQLDRLQ
jgi:hypothetical protein